ncbi:MAG: tetratricopeptide repeat protein [Planctomycetota bacterium]
MSQERFRRARSIFDRACDLPPDEQEAVLRAECGDDPELRAEVEKLLAADRAPSSNIDTPLPDQLPKSIGGYRIVRVIGQGGMGTVYEAEQSNPRRRVALKLISFATPELLKRFEYEAEILGRLNHPGIARIFEAGVSEGRPFFAMEYIEGVPLDTYIRQQALSTDQRLDLLARIADAVQHAHLQGVVHRDLKPGNILVEKDGTPRLLDFGVAKLTTADARLQTLDTRAGQLLGTLPYMSPEQFTSEPIDVRTDVYALGVIGYEMLEEKLPRDFTGKSLPEAVAYAQRAETAQLSRKGDAETVVGKALQTQRARRYGSAGELADDLRRVLRDEPIVARPPSASYQLRKLVRRHRATATGVAIALVAIVAGGVFSFTQFLRAEERRVEAEEARALAVARAETRNEMLGFLIQLFDVVDPDEARGRTVTAKEILDAGARDLRVKLEDQPEVRSQLMLMIGRIYLRLGLREPAEPLVTEALAIRRELYGDASPELITALQAAASLELARGDFGKAVAYARRALTLGPRDPLNRGELGVALERAGRYREAEKEFRTVLRDVDDNKALHGLAVVLRRQGKFEEAEQMARSALARKRKEVGDIHPDVVKRRATLATALTELGRFEEAESQFRAATDAQEKLTGKDSAEVAGSLSTHAKLLITRGEYERAQVLLERARALALRWYGPRHPLTITITANFGAVASGQRRIPDALDYYEEALRQQRAVSGDEHPVVASYLSSRGTLLLELKRFDEAQASFEEARKLLLGYHGTERHPDYAKCLVNLAIIERDRGNMQEAIVLFRRGFDLGVDLLGEDAAETVHYLFQYGRLLSEQAKYDEARKVLMRAREIFDARFEPTLPARLGCLGTLATVEIELGNFAEADKLLAETVQRHTELYGPNHANTKGSKSKRARLAQRRGDYRTSLSLHAELWQDPPEDPVQRLTLQNNYALVLLLMHQLEKAEEMFRDAREALVKLAGPSHHLVGTMTHNIAECRRRAGKESAEGFRAALKIYRGAFPDGKHPLIANTMTKLGQATGDRDLMEEALAKRRLQLPAGHPDIAKSLVALGDEASLKEAVAILDAAMPDSLIAAEARSDYAARLTEARNKEAARALLERALPALQAGFGPDHPATKRAAERLKAAS